MITPPAGTPEAAANPRASRPVRLAYLVSHPIQYQAPLLRRIAAEPDIDLTVFFASDFSASEYSDRGFGVGVRWDTPLLEGYRYEVLPHLRDQRRTGPLAQINHGLWSRLRKGTHAGSYDALWVHGYSTVTALTGILAAKALGIPVLLRAESRIRGRNSLPKQIIKRTFFSALQQVTDAVLPIGSANAHFWHHYFGGSVPEFLMPYAVDNAYFQQQAEQARQSRGSLLEELGLDAGRPVILFASKLQTRKRCADLIEAYLRVSSDRRPYLLIVGDGDQRAALERCAAGHPDILFCGFRNQSELARFFDIATVFVLPSEGEQWGLVVNEVMNSARPVIVSGQVGCHHDLVTDGVEGFVFPVGDIHALSRAIHRILQKPEDARAMGIRALERIHSWSFDQDIDGLRHALAHVTRKLPCSNTYTPADPRADILNI